MWVPSTAVINCALGATVARYIVHRIFVFLAHVESLTGRIRIQQKNPPAHQLLRELDWDNPLIGSVAAVLVIQLLTPCFDDMVEFTWKGVSVCFLSHYLIVEPLYYAYHRVLHLRRFYQGSHKHHHTSVVTQSTSGTSHPLLETLGYLAVFSFPITVPAWCHVLSPEIFYIYVVFFDVMNCIGHCNFEAVPLWLQRGPLKYLLYSSSYHSLHHTIVLTNYCLFCPLWDYAFGTVSSQAYGLQHEIRTTIRPRSVPAVFVVHGIEWSSIFHMPMISPYLSTQQCTTRAWMYPWFPLCFLLVMFSRVFLRVCPTQQRFTYNGFRGAIWTTPYLAYSYLWPREYASINKLLVRAAHDAEAQGATHIGLAALNKAVFLNKGGEDLIPVLRKGCRVKIVTGNTLTAAIAYIRVRDAVPLGEELFFTGATSSVGAAVVLRLLQEGYRFRILTRSKERFDRLQQLAGAQGGSLVRADCYEDGVACHTWILGTALNKPIGNLVKAGTKFLEFAVPRTRDSLIHPFVAVHVGNVAYESNKCDLTLACDCAQGEMPACLAGTLIHAMEGFTEHEVGAVDASKLDHWVALAAKHGMIRERGLDHV
eukprot:NODE_4746_length_1852_cov_9.861449.p1 GENE.NODE_4746_length_1852_cov_9.861449~~NODE_4746_length_1852_cov_9.861449.p1  ORF type:complete len:605 (+),score=55.73 NODE_4746_length_1852_cov_9.861449:35-1816(+)